MFKKLSHQFVFIVMMIMTVITITVMVFAFIYQYHTSIRDMHGSLDLLINYGNTGANHKIELGPGTFSDLPPSVLLVLPKNFDGLDHSAIKVYEFNGTINDDRMSEVLNTISERDVSEKYGYIRSMKIAYETGRNSRGEIVVALISTSTLSRNLLRIMLSEIVIAVVVLLTTLAITIVSTKLALKPIKEAWEKQKQFIADASHELKTPLTVILANNNILQSHPDERVGDQEQWLTSTQDEAARMKGLIDEMLFLAKSDDGSVPLNIVDLNFSDMLEEAALTFEPVAFERNVTIETEITPSIHISADKALFERFIRIFIDNAVKHSEKGGVVKIKLASEGNKKVYSVNNVGDIISPKDLPHIFDRFYRADTSRSSSGYGLGLSIADSIAKSIGGVVTVTSNAQTGTTFTVTL